MCFCECYSRNLDVNTAGLDAYSNEILVSKLHIFKAPFGECVCEHFEFALISFVPPNLIPKERERETIFIFTTCFKIKMSAGQDFLVRRNLSEIRSGFKQKPFFINARNFFIVTRQFDSFVEFTVKVCR